MTLLGENLEKLDVGRIKGLNHVVKLVMYSTRLAMHVMVKRKIQRNGCQIALLIYVLLAKIVIKHQRSIAQEHHILERKRR